MKRHIFLCQFAQLATGFDPGDKGICKQGSHLFHRATLKYLRTVYTLYKHALTKHPLLVLNQGARKVSQQLYLQG